MNRTKKQPRAVLLGVLACLCLLLQQTSLLIHVALHESHSHAADSHEAHAHDHSGAPHLHAAPEVGHEHGRHAPHPVEDHLGQVGDTAGPTKRVQVAFALPTLIHQSLVFDLPALQRVVDIEASVLSTPRRSTAIPRAPPVMS